MRLLFNAGQHPLYIQRAYCPPLEKLLQRQSHPRLLSKDLADDGRHLEEFEGTVMYALLLSRAQLPSDSKVLDTFIETAVNALIDTDQSLLLFDCLHGEHSRGQPLRHQPTRNLCV